MALCPLVIRTGGSRKRTSLRHRDHDGALPLSHPRATKQHPIVFEFFEFLSFPFDRVQSLSGKNGSDLNEKTPRVVDLSLIHI